MSETTKVTTHYWLPLQETSNGFILKLFTQHDAVKWSVMRLFDKEVANPVEEFKILEENFPALWKKIVDAGVDTTPPLEKVPYIELKDGGFLHELKVPLEFIVYLNENGKPNKRATWPETLAMWAGKASGASEAGEDAVYQGFEERHEELLSLVGREVFELARSSLYTVNAIYQEITGAKLENVLDENELFKTVFYQTSRSFDRVRGAMTLSLDKARQGLTDDFQVIRDGELKDFSQDIADGHYLIDDREEVKEILNALGISITKDTVKEFEEVDKRVEVAAQVWLFADLKKYDKTGGKAVEVVNETFNPIPW